ncbi:SDR family oxidoreductase [Actinomadura syzygii]|uniref:Sugar nucleotide-binding protein n=1 Tax=Actinomadura syzygii TaxID=1427538 RepID=A0A5D0TSA0_9ACTN|nr:sugar nucleotide-binding protein [Actinomadura syzygii]TYC08707.1 sugar nucleotide-binding protein [Actinomadura syzygii]
MSILIVGGNGHLGRRVVRQAVAAGHTVAATYASRPGDASVHWLPVDLRVPDQIAAALTAARPSVVINVAVRAADWATTADGAARLAAMIGDHECRLVHVSSDAVFSGSDVHYDEDALPDPVTPYGAAKAAAETAIRALTPSAVIARTSLIIGDGDSKHETLVRDLATGQREGELFVDDIRCPVHADDLAAALLEITATDIAGTVHLAGVDAVSRHELGVLLARRDGIDPGLLRPGRRADSARPGALDIRLDGTRTQKELTTRLRGAHEFLTSAQNC